MFLNVNGTVQKRPVRVDGILYKVANQAYYPINARSEVIAHLEVCRKHCIRIRIVLGDTSVHRGYIRHVVIDGLKYPQFFCRKDSTKGKNIRFPIELITSSRWGYLIYKREP